MTSRPDPEVSGLDPELVLARPELVVTTLLQHALQAARHALAFAHPEMHDEGPAVADEPTDLAFQIAGHIVDLDRALVRYHRAVAARWRSDTFDDTLPF